MAKLLKALVASGAISQDTATQIMAEFNAEDDAEAKVDDEVQAVMDTEPDIYMAEVILKMEGKSLAERRRIGKSKAIRANLQSTLCRQNKDGFGARKWSQVAWALKNQR
tara:strand:- start:42 stop:368 length:327 start_codon:yes stop_codon:yes gene_type:complete